MKRSPMIPAVALMLVSAAALGPEASAQELLWEHAYGGVAEDIVYAVQEIPGGGYVFAGYTSSFGAGGRDGYLIRTDADGDTLWTRTYGGSLNDATWSIELTPDDGFVMAGETASYGHGGTDVYLVRTDADGDTLWTRTYGDLGDDTGNAIARTREGGYAIAGRGWNMSTGNVDVYLVIVDAWGNLLSTHYYGQSGWDVALDLEATAEGGFILGGATNSFGAGGFDQYLIKTDAGGDTLWTRTYGGEEDEWCHGLTQTRDWGYVLAGNTMSFSVGDFDAYAVRTTALGDTLWTRVYGGPYRNDFNAVAETPDGGFVRAGDRADPSAAVAWGVRMGADGDTLWTHNYGRGGVYNLDSPGDLSVTSDGSFVLAGLSERPGTSMYDAWILKIRDDFQNLLLTGSVAPLRVSPNPCRATTTISAHFTNACHTAVSVYGLQGEKIGTVFDGPVEAGTRAFTWNFGQHTTGIFFFKLTNGARTLTRKVTLVE